MASVTRFHWVLVALILAVYAQSISFLKHRRNPAVAPELLITLPRAAQILFSAGDRHLAASLSGFRVLVADTARMTEHDYAVQARLQKDIAWLNPAHEDNYYIAANILPWGGQIDAAEEVLRRAFEARPTDFLPGFHVGFIYYHFRRDPAEGARWLQLAATRTSDQQDQWGLQVVASKWIERGYDTVTAANMVGAMARNAPPGGFRSYLNLREQRLRSLVVLREAAQAYRQRHARPPSRLEDLVTDGFIKEIPKDPVGSGFVISAEGEPVFAAR